MIHVVMQFSRWASESVAWYSIAMLPLWVVHILVGPNKVVRKLPFLVLVRLNGSRIMFLPYCSFHFLFTHTSINDV